MNNCDHIIGVYGASGFGKEVMPLLHQHYPFITLVFIDDAQNQSSLNAYPILNYQEFLNYNAIKKSCIIAIANGQIRENLTKKLKLDGIDIISIFAENSLQLDNNIIGEGTILCPFTTVTSNVIIGKSFHANLYSYIAHDCIIGDYVTFAPHVMCNGNVHIEDHVYIGTGAMIKQGTPDKPIIIGKGATIGMGSVVTKSVQAGDIVFGMPAKSIKRGK